MTQLHERRVIERRRSHIKMVGTMLKNARIDDRGLCRILGKGASNLMRHWIRQLEDRLSDLDALQCKCCEVWIPVDELIAIEITADRPDENPTDELICQDCKDCPPDEPDR